MQIHGWILAGGHQAHIIPLCEIALLCYSNLVVRAAARWSKIIQKKDRNHFIFLNHQFGRIRDGCEEVWRNIHPGINAVIRKQLKSQSYQLHMAAYAPEWGSQITDTDHVYIVICGCAILSGSAGAPIFTSLHRSSQPSHGSKIPRNTRSRSLRLLLSPIRQLYARF